MIANDNQDNKNVQSLVSAWSKRTFTRFSAPPVTVENRKGNILSWLMACMFRDDTTLNQEAVHTFTAQAILRGSCGWSEPFQPTPPLSPTSEPLPASASSPAVPAIRSREEIKEDEIAAVLGSTVAELLDRGWSWESVVDSIGHMSEPSDVQKWKADLQLDEFNCLKPKEDWNLKQDAVHHDSSLKNLKVVIRGMRKGWEQVMEIMETKPGVAMFQEIKTPRHKVKSLQKLVSQFLPNYTLVTSIAMGTGARTVSHGVATLVRSDYMTGARVLPISDKLDRKVAGRILALQIAGAGAKSPILLVNVYQAVNVPNNLESIENVFKAVQDLRNRAVSHQIPTVAAGGWNATLGPTQRFNYKGKEWEQGDALFQRFTRKCNWKVQSPCEWVMPTWFSHAGNQEAVLDHVLSFPSFLWIGKVRGKRLQDSRFDHSTLTVEIDCRDAGFQTEIDEVNVHFPRIIGISGRPCRFWYMTSTSRTSVLKTCRVTSGSDSNKN